MIKEIIQVDNEVRQVVDFSKPGAPGVFHMPLRIGAGYRHRIKLARNGAAIVGEKYSLMAAELVRSSKKPNGMSDEMWADEMRTKLQSKIADEIERNELQVKTVDENLAVLETLLVPMGDTPSVKVWYDQYAEEEEVAFVVNFSRGLVESRTATEPLPITSGEDTSPRVTDED